MTGTCSAEKKQIQREERSGWTLAREPRREFSSGGEQAVHHFLRLAQIPAAEQIEVI
jgi:hypothetical protein